MSSSESDLSVEENDQEPQPLQKLQLLQDDDENDSEQNAESQGLIPRYDMEAKSRKVEQKEEQDVQESKLELSHLQQQDELLEFHFPDSHTLQKEEELGVDMAIVWARIQDVIRILNNLRLLKDPSRSRAEYVELLKHDLMYYYGYGELMLQSFFNMFSVEEMLQLLEANEKNRPITIRTNTLKSRRKELQDVLAERGVQLEAVPWSEEGLQVFTSRIPIGATPEYLAGHYMIQSASSLTAVMALDPKPGERILDMCAAPGGKTTHIAAKMKNQGVLVANDINAERIAALTANLHRLGVKNCIWTNIDGKKYKTYMAGFDRILLDAPCTGSGIISRDPQIKIKKTKEDLRLLCKDQKELILSAIDSCADEGIIVYSTCSILVEENEDIIEYALSRRPVKLVATGLSDFGVQGFTKYLRRRYNASMVLTKRFYPHVYNMDGFFVAKLRKYKKQTNEETNKKTKKRTRTSQNDPKNLKNKKRKE